MDLIFFCIHVYIVCICVLIVSVGCIVFVVDFLFSLFILKEC